MKLLYTLFFILYLFCLSAQDIAYGKSAFDKTGIGGGMVTADVSFKNSGSDTIEIFVNRFYKNLPANWTSCFCFIQCHLPAEDTLRFKLAPDEIATIGVGFNTDTLPGIGYVKITMEQVGGTQKDTLSFSGSTMIAGINELSSKASFKLYPNPSVDKVILSSVLEESFSARIFDITGKQVKEIQNLEGRKNEVSISDLIAGEYFLQLTYRSGKTETQKIIKN